MYKDTVEGELFWVYLYLFFQILCFSVFLCEMTHPLLSHREKPFNLLNRVGYV